MEDSVFNQILDKDERIIRVIRPNGKKFFWSMFLLSTFCNLFYFIILCAAIPEADEQFEPMHLVYAGIVIGILFVLTWLLTWAFARKVHKNRIYAYTNKRVIVRSGVFGVNFLAMEIKNISLSFVRITLIDKIAKQNTGTIVFSGINNMPMMACMFKHIKNPYETLKEIKEYFVEK